MYVTVYEAAQRLAISENAVRNRIKRGSLRAIKAQAVGAEKGAQVLVLMGDGTGAFPAHEAANIPTNSAANSEIESLEVVIAYQKRRIDDLQAERKRLNDLLLQHIRLLEREVLWRENMQLKLERLLDDVAAEAGPEDDRLTRAEVEADLKPALSDILQSLGDLVENRKKQTGPS